MGSCVNLMGKEYQTDMKLAPQSLSLETIKDVRFASWWEFVDDVTGTVSGDRYCSASSRCTGDEKWNGTRTWENAVEQAKTGNASLTKALNAHITRTLEHMAPAPVTEMYLDVTTDYGWDMGTAITGNPQAGVNFWEVESTARKHCRIVINNSASCSVSKEQLEYRGTLAYILYLTLTQKGYDVSIDLLTLISYGYRKQATVRIAVPLVHPGENFDIAVLAYALISPSVLRRLYFSLIETLGNDDVWQRYGAPSAYGYPTLLGPADRGDISIDGDMTDCFKTWDTLPNQAKQVIEHATRLIEEFQAKAGN